MCGGERVGGMGEQGYISTHYFVCRLFHFHLATSMSCSVLVKGGGGGLTNRFQLLFQIWSVYCGCLEPWVGIDFAVTFGLSGKESHDLLRTSAMYKGGEGHVYELFT